MPRETVSIAESYHSITRPVAISVIKDMLKNLGLNKDTSIIFPGFADQVPYNGSTTDDGTPTTPVNMPTRQQATITVNETYADHTARSENPLYIDAIPVFYDKKLNVMVKPVYNTVLMDIGIILKGSDATTIRRWFIHLKNMITRDFQTGAHLINYSYVIPEGIMLLLMEIYNKRESQLGYGDPISKYIKGHMTDRFAIDTNQAGKANTPLIREEQTMVHAWFELDQTNPQQPQKNQGTGEWELELNYKFYYSKIEKLVVEYPIVIHNQQIDTKFINLDNLPAFEQNYLQRTTDARMPLNHFLGHRDYGTQEQLDPGLPIPWYDEWRMPTGLYNGSSEASFLRILTLAEATTKTLVNLHDLGDFKLTLAMLQYLKRRPMALTKIHDSVFTIRVFRDDNLVNMALTTVDSNLNIGHQLDYKLRNTYRVTLNILTDPSLLSDEGLADLGANPCFAADYFFMITGSYKYFPKPAFCPLDPNDSSYDPNDPNYNPNPYPPLTIDQLKDIISKIDKFTELQAAPPYYRMYTVGQYTLRTRRNS